jgi:glycosyltransferase involved in cell wall biosynthesis
MTNKGKGGTRSYDVAKHMVKAGHSVHMITGIYDISGLDPMPWYHLFRKEQMDGIDVTVCNVGYSNKLSGLRRTWSFLWFAVLATIAAVRISRPQLVFATSTPLTVGIPGCIAAALKRVPFVFEVRDIWPESFVLSGWVSEKALSVRLMAALESFCYKKAVKILLVSKGFEERLIERGLDPAKLKTILLGADGTMFENITPDETFLDKCNLRNKTIAIFTGAHGKANGLDYILDAAELTGDRKDIAYVLIGEGSEKQKLIAAAASRGLDNVVFAEPVPKCSLPGILAVCHIGLMILKHIEGGRPVTPNKIFDYMFVGLPSIVNFRGPTDDMVKELECGLFAEGDNPRSLAEQVTTLADNPSLRQTMGHNARKAAWERYDRRIIARQLMETFEQILQSCGGKAKK